ncbi:hypothetical protein F5Y06DRAFT_296995 [Hypoxylon sp. FL0890]|nr:hypothetical protein F5Y06DRAFT_296995 [Hypoxylon sp. FL0890]
MKTSFVLAAIATVLSVVQAAPSEERAPSILDGDEAPPKTDNTTEVQKQGVPDMKVDVGTSDARQAEDDIFNKRMNCQAYPCEDMDDCRPLGCRGGCHLNEFDLLRCYS